jgi:lysophospholipase L1-like esterase
MSAAKPGTGRRGRLALSVGAILVSLLALESGFRLYHAVVDARSRYQPADDPSVLFVGKPHFAPGVNALGFRDVEHAIPKPPGVYRILVLGDSVTAGYGVEFADAYPRRLASLLRGREDQSYEVVNFGLSQYSTVQEVALFRERGSRMRPDLVVLAYVLNDPTRDGGINDYFERHRAPSLAAEWLTRRSKELLRVPEGVERIPGCRSFDYYSWMHCDADKWARVSAAFGDLGSLSRRDGFRVLVVIFPLLPDSASFSGYPWQSIHHRVAAEAARNGFATLDLLAVFAERTPSELALAPSDPLHPSRLGHEIAAQAIYRELSDLGVGSSRTQ